MIPETIENVIRDFPFHNYGLPPAEESFGSTDWVRDLTNQISQAITPDIEIALRGAMMAGIKIDRALAGRTGDELPA